MLPYTRSKKKGRQSVGCCAPYGSTWPSENVGAVWHLTVPVTLGGFHICTACPVTLHARAGGGRTAGRLTAHVTERSRCWGCGDTRIKRLCHLGSVSPGTVSDSRGEPVLGTVSAGRSGCSEGHREAVSHAGSPPILLRGSPFFVSVHLGGNRFAMTSADTFV